MPNSFAKGFEAQPEELTLVPLTVTGDVPAWLHGTFVRNGPGQFAVGDSSYRHWFDGLAMLRSFTFDNGNVAYSNRFLRSASYIRDHETGKVNYRGFAVDPCRSFFQKLTSMFATEADALPNAVVSVQKIADRFIAMTESPMAVEFDPKTLKTLGLFDYDGSTIDAQTATAHPHQDFGRGVGYNYSLKLSNRSEYQVYAIEGRKRRLLARYPVQRPAYIHSFAITQRYVVIAENGLRLPGLRALLDLALMNNPFIESFAWQPNEASRFIVIDKDSGDVVHIAEAEPFFVFHHINAYEDPATQQLVLDMSTYPDNDVIQGFYLDNMRGNGYPRYSGEFRRYCIDLAQGQRSSATQQKITDASIDLPRINYKPHNGQPYRYAYGVSARPNSDDFVDQIAKVDTDTGQALTWHEPRHYPGEPVFIAAPNATTEDDGVVLTAVLDADEGTSYLLILDAKTFQPLARADVPHHIPFGFHGQFFA